jgi:hypothetical protein
VAKGFSFSTLGAKHSNHMLGWKSLSHLLYGGIGQGLNVSGASSNPVSRQNFHADKGRLKIQILQVVLVLLWELSGMFG